MNAWTPSTTFATVTTRRAFVAGLTAAAIAPSFRRDALLRASELAAHGGAPDDEDYWREIQRAFDLDRSIINLNNGGVSPSPTDTGCRFKGHADIA